MRGLFVFRHIYIPLYGERRYENEDYQVHTQADIGNYHLGIDYLGLEVCNSVLQEKEILMGLFLFSNQCEEIRANNMSFYGI